MFAALALCLLGTGQAFAIPSPELVVGSFVSISQLFALASAVLGGGAAFATMRARKRGGSAEMSRGLLYTAVGLFAVMTVSIGVNIWQYVERVQRTAGAPREHADAADAEVRRAGRLDPDAKEVSYAQQLQHPRGISTEEMEKLLEAHRSRRSRPGHVSAGRPRNRGAAEMGTLHGRDDRPLPRPQERPIIDFTGKTVIAVLPQRQPQL